MQKLRWGVLSTAKIGTEKVIPAMQRGRLAEVVAIASRDLDRSRTVAARLGIPVAHGSYEELLADPTVEAVYIPLPNHLHLPWTLRALEAGKHVLCEKPIGVTAAEAEALVDAARARPALKVMEAFMYRFHPQWVHVLARIGRGDIGRPRVVEAFFSYHNVDPRDIRNQAASGGGGLLDIGCYCISVSRLVFGSEPARVTGWMELDPEFGTDRLTSGLLEFPTGIATFNCSTRLTPFQRVTIFGEEGAIEVEMPFTPAPEHACTVRRIGPGSPETVSIDPADHYTLQGDAFSGAVLEDQPVPTPLTDALGNMRVIDSLSESARQRRWVEVGTGPG